MITPDNEVFRINTMGTYHVIEAAVKLGIRKIVIASSETTYGLVFANEPRNPIHFPLEEDYPVDPMDSYALSKVCNEKTAQAFALRSGFDIYALRIGNVIEPDEYQLFPKWFADPGFRRRIAWSYIDARDLGQIVGVVAGAVKVRGKPHRTLLSIAQINLFWRQMNTLLSATAHGDSNSR